MRRTGPMLKPSPVDVDILDGLLESLQGARKRWRTLDRQGIRAVFRELKAQRGNLIRQEGLHPPNSPLRLAFQCQRAVVDLHILELKKVAGEMGGQNGGGGGERVVLMYSRPKGDR